MTQTEEDERWMRLALEQAKQGMATPGAGEVGCVIVRNGELMAQAFNEVEGSFDPTAHAEIVCLRKLGQTLRTPEFHGCTLYCTLQCCGMCTLACVWGKISRIVYGAARGDVHRMYFEAQHWNTADFIADTFRDDMEVTGGVLAQECSELYYSQNDEPPREEQKNR